MKYAKLINKELVLAPNPIVINGRQIGNPPGEVYLSEGYKPVIYTEPPEVEPGFIATPYWEETEVMGDAVIAQMWRVELAPVTEEEALVRYSNELTGAEDETLAEATETLIKTVMEVN